MAQSYHLLLLTDNAAVKQQIDRFCEPLHEKFCRITIETEWLDQNHYDAILFTKDKIHLTVSGQYDHLQLPFVYLNEQKNNETIFLWLSRVSTK